MDNFLLQAIAGELESLLRGQRLGKIVQLNTTDVAFDFRLRDGRLLTVSTDPARLALYLTARPAKQLSPEFRTDTAFVALAKKYLSNAKLVAVEKLGYDRVLNFEFEAEEESGQLHRRTLIVLLTGRGANVLVTEKGRVPARLRESADADGSDTYSEPAPPADKLDPFLCSAAQLYDLIADAGGDIATAAQKNFIGFAPAYARELAFRAQTTDAELALQELLRDLFESNPVPTLYSAPSLEELRRNIGCEEYSLTLSPIELRHLFALDQTGFATVNEAADACFRLLDTRRHFLARKQKLSSQFNAKLKKQRTLAANLRRELAGFAKAETHQRWAELLLANLHQIEKAEKAEKNGGKFKVTDFYDDAQATIEIPAADKATAREAAEHYFKLARKARHGFEAITARLPEIEREIADLENKLASLAAVTRPEELNANFEEAAPQLIRQEKPKTQPGKKPKEEKLTGLRRYRSTDGYEILIGRTDRDNDNLTLRIAKSYDLWFHAADYPGSHAVLRNPQRREVPMTSILEAAQLAAKFSQARDNAKVAVNYCEKKFVTKPKGFAPGQVRLASFKTVMVEPREAGEKL
ncbi:MAG TPA: NFACT family protein [Blastocatellia bacterium]|nr:NFACT family protein [Blastocatellia bacterium]HNG32901.1 NFACT family protein [Blastocatellia bacterium]